MEKSYIANLRYGTTQMRVWFMGEDSIESEEAWKDALKSLEAIGDSCNDAQEFFLRAISNFKDHGFLRIKD